MNQDYVVQELLGMISTQQQQGRVFPELSNDRILEIADSFLFEWNELGDPDANFEAMLEWTLDQNLAHA
jgi:hypothetical protein|tara:strand:- start:252 stop:458 length:207 start_codon:yes stop_codon:yes gene_type:complete